MKYYVYSALILVLINLIITGIVCLVKRENNKNISFFAMFAGVDGVLALIAGVIVLLYSLCEKSIGSAILLGVYLGYYLPVAAVLFIIAVVFYLVTKTSQKDAEQQAQLNTTYKNNPSEELKEINDYSELLKLTNQLENIEIENLLVEQENSD